MHALRPLHAGMALALTVGLVTLLTAVLASVTNDALPLLFSTWWHAASMSRHW